MREWHPIVVPSVISNVQRFPGWCLRTCSRTSRIIPHSEGRTSGRHTPKTTGSKAFASVGIPGSVIRHVSVELGANMTLLSLLREPPGHPKYEGLLRALPQHSRTSERLGA